MGFQPHRYGNGNTYTTRKTTEQYQVDIFDIYQCIVFVYVHMYLNIWEHQYVFTYIHYIHIYLHVAYGFDATVDG